MRNVLVFFIALNLVLATYLNFVIQIIKVKYYLLASIKINGW